MYNLFPYFSYVPLITSILVTAIVGLTSYLAVFKLKYFKILEENPLVPPFISVTSGILGLLLAFLASAVWHNSSIAEEALQRENMAIRRLYDLPLEPPEIKIQAENQLDKYIQLVQQKEWGLHKNSIRLAEVDSVCIQLSALTWKMNSDAQLSGKATAFSASSIITTEYIKWLEQLETARENRLSLGRLSQMGYVNKWIIIYLLTLLSGVSIAAVHRGKPKTAIIALVIFCSAIAMAYSMISLFVHPYRGPGALEPSLTVFTNGLSQGVR